MPRPTIGITSPLQRAPLDGAGDGEVADHARLLEAHGAATVILPRGDATAGALATLKLQGILFSGGGDVSATLYGGKPELAFDRVDLARDTGELTLLRTAYAERVPMLCVCRGLQLANIAFGGTLIEDIKTELRSNYSICHNQVRELKIPANQTTHEVHAEAGSLLEEITGERSFLTNSVHHQALRSIAPPLTSIAHTDDGIVEAVELVARDFFFLGVQWHPEALPDDNVSSLIYSALINAAGANSPRAWSPRVVEE